jgi:hypothetical protein
MFRTNHNDELVQETLMFKCWSDAATEQERDTAINLILEHLKMEIVKTNATKHGTVELELRKES